MKIFVDTANLEEIKAAMDTGFVDGVTTNPSLLAKEPKARFEEHIGQIVELLKKYKEPFKYGPGAYKHLSVEVFSRDSEKIFEQARKFQELFQYEALSVKIQIGWPELNVIRNLRQIGISVNCTACMTVSQAVWAAKVGADYASLFWGRIRDGGDNPEAVVAKTRAIFDREKFCQIIAGSMRSVWDVRDAMLAGAHIVTVPYKFFPEFPKMVQHFKTDEVVQQFLTDFEKWLR